MADTVRDIATLLSTYLNDNVNREISPQDLRDAIVSLAGRGQPMTSQTGAVTPGVYDSFVPCNATGGAFTVTLPTLASVGNGKVYTVKKTDSSANAVTVDGNGSETIEGAANYSLASQNKYVTVIAFTGGWLIIGNN